MGSSLRAVAPRCLSRENAGKTMTVLHHALWGDYFDQTPLSTIFSFFFFFGFVSDTTQVLSLKEYVVSQGNAHPAPKKPSTNKETPTVVW